MSPDVEHLGCASPQWAEVAFLSPVTAEGLMERTLSWELGNLGSNSVGPLHDVTWSWSASLSGPQFWHV